MQGCQINHSPFAWKFQQMVNIGNLHLDQHSLKDFSTIFCGYSLQI